MTTKRHPDACPGGCGVILLERLRGTGAKCRACDPSDRNRALSIGEHGVFFRERAALLAALVCPGTGPGRPCCAALNDGPMRVDNLGDRCDSCLEDLALTDLGDGGVVAPEDRELVEALMPSRRETIVRAADGTPVEVRPLF